MTGQLLPVAVLALAAAERRSQFRVRASLSGQGTHPFRWEIYDDEDGRTVRRSLDRFRSSKAAWHAGLAVLDAQDGAEA